MGSGCTAFAYGSELERVRQKAVKEVLWTCERPWTPTVLDPNLTLTRTQCPAIPSNTGNKKPLT